MKRMLPKELLAQFQDEALEGMGRETEIGGGNTVVEITVFGSDVAAYPDLAWLAGGTVRVYLNKRHKYIGHKVVGPKRR